MSDSITEQAARLIDPDGWRDIPPPPPDGVDDAWREGHLRYLQRNHDRLRAPSLAIARALADAGLLAHQAPATGDEAATDYVPANRVYGEVIPMAASTRDRAAAEAEVARMRDTLLHHADRSLNVFLASRVRSEWVEVSR